MRRTCFTLLGLALLALAGPVCAEPTVISGGPTSPNAFGTTGLLFTPSAYTVGDRGIDGGIFATSNFETYGATVGLGNRLEVGGTYLSSHGFGHSGFLANGKFALLRENAVIPALSVGITDAFDQLHRDPSFYVVASKDLQKLVPVPLRLHAGWGTGLYDKQVFLGGELGIGTPLNLVPLAHPSVSAIAEWENHDLNVGLRARYRGFAGTIGLFDLDHFGGGISYTTGLRL